MLTERLTRSLLFAAYQSSLLLGILMLPIALAAKRLGVTLRYDRVIDASERAYRAR